MSIAKRVQELMKARNWSEGELSRQSGVSQPTIHRIISGESQSPRQGNVEKLAKTLGCSAGWLWGDKDFPAPNESPAAQPDVAALVTRLASSKSKASPRSQAVISRLVAAAQQGKLDDTAWALIGSMLTELEKR